VKITWYWWYLQCTVPDCFSPLCSGTFAGITTDFARANASGALFFEAERGLADPKPGVQLTFINSRAPKVGNFGGRMTFRNSLVL
jgi:hypothetical protein